MFSRFSSVFQIMLLSDEVYYSMKICTFCILGLKFVISVEKCPEVLISFGTPVKMSDCLTSEAKNTFK